MAEQIMSNIKLPLPVPELVTVTLGNAMEIEPQHNLMWPHWPGSVTTTVTRSLLLDYQLIAAAVAAPPLVLSEESTCHPILTSADE